MRSIDNFHGVLIVLAFIALAFGLYQMSNVTVGVGLIGVACLLGILARMSQAAQHQRELLRALGVPDPKLIVESRAAPRR